MISLYCYEEIFISSSELLSVVIISVGLLTNLARLINSSPDRYSPLNGKELIHKKVKFMSLMGGDFRPDRSEEYNICNDIAAAEEVLENWPSDITILGDALSHPLKQAYEYYLAMPYDRPNLGSYLRALCCRTLKTIFHNIKGRLY